MVCFIKIVVLSETERQIPGQEGGRWKPAGPKIKWFEFHWTATVKSGLLSHSLHKTSWQPNCREKVGGGTGKDSMIERETDIFPGAALNYCNYNKACHDYYQAQDMIKTAPYIFPFLCLLMPGSFFICE